MRVHNKQVHATQDMRVRVRVRVRTPIIRIHSHSHTLKQMRNGIPIDLSAWNIKSEVSFHITNDWNILTIFNETDIRLIESGQWTRFERVP